MTPFSSAKSPRSQVGAWHRDLTIGDRYSPRPVSFQDLPAFRPGPGRRCRVRCCLLKGCEQAFVPLCPQARYCTEACARSAQQWRRWRASRRYRASESGRECRRAQHSRYRQRQRERAAALSAGEAADDRCDAATEVSSGEREGQRPVEFSEDFVVCSCHRPGCYVQFVVAAAGTNRRFCSLACRLALRRVLDREARYRQRRRRWRWLRLSRRCQPPDTS